ncbi:hypothetical protein [Paraburkholderia sartisoli]|uniref:hypothetical protein n=1 Tax=Paraburkholderia sartisoli TaxID=83784 RepID=UPI000B81912C|nr:hypothetical protein [Paraburkholderia sartisoli]
MARFQSRAATPRLPVLRVQQQRLEFLEFDGLHLMQRETCPASLREIARVAEAWTGPMASGAPDAMHYWLAPDTPDAPTTPAAAGALAELLMPVLPVSPLVVSARLQPLVPAANTTSDAAIRTFLRVGFM